MDTQLIPRAAYLDLIFDGRNKSYGAYQLRTGYSGRMQRAAFVLLSLTTLLSLSLFLPTEKKMLAMPVPMPQTEVFEYHEYKIEPPKEVLPKTQGGGRTAKTEAFVQPKVVEDTRVDPKKTIVEQANLTQAVVGTETSTGDGTVGVSSAGSGTGTGTGTGSGNEGKEETDLQKDFTVAEVNPEFPGGEAALMRYLSDEIQFPEQARNAHQQGKVVARFLVAKDGSIESIIIKKSFGFGSEEETIRVLQKMPKWHPGMVNGKPVRCWIQLPVQFVLE